jgi:hypothetical protein
VRGTPTLVILSAAKDLGVHAGREMLRCAQHELSASFSGKFYKRGSRKAATAAVIFSS